MEQAKGPVIIYGRGDRVQMTFYKKIFHGPLVARQFFDAHSWCKIFMYFRVELICKLCMFNCNSEGYWGLKKDAARAAKIFPENNFYAPSGLLNIFSMPTL